MTDRSDVIIIDLDTLDGIIEQCVTASRRNESGPYARDYALWNIAQGTLAYMIRERLARHVATGSS